jgi:hypothetical protein
MSYGVKPHFFLHPSLEHRNRINMNLFLTENAEEEYAFNPQPSTLNPQPSTLDSKP